MKKLLVILGVLLMAQNCFAGIVSIDSLTSDTDITFTWFNNAINAIKTEINGNIQSINIADATINSSDIAIAANPLKRDNENIGEYVYSGGTIASGATLPATSTITTMVAYITNDANGYLHRVATADTSHTFNASKDTYVYCDYAGSFVYQEVNNNASQPSDPANSIILAKVVTDATTVASVVDLRQTTPVNLRIYSDYRQGCIVSWDTTSTIRVMPGEIELGTSGKKRRNTTPLTLTWADIDTGAEAGSTYYYVFAYPDPNSSVTFAGTISTATSDSAKSNDRVIGYFYNDESSNISKDAVGSHKLDGSGLPNINMAFVSTDVSVTSTGWTPMPGMTVKFYSSGRPVQFIYDGPIRSDAIVTTVGLQIDNVNDKATTSVENAGNYPMPCSLQYMEAIPVGTHTAKIMWRVSGSTGYQDGATYGARKLIVNEL